MKKCFEFLSVSGNPIIGHEYPTMHFFGNPRHSVIYSIIYDFVWVFLEIPVKNCIMGMFLTCPIAVLNWGKIALLW